MMHENTIFHGIYYEFRLLQSEKRMLSFILGMLRNFFFYENEILDSYFK